MHRLFLYECFPVRSLSVLADFAYFLPRSRTPSSLYIFIAAGEAEPAVRSFCVVGPVLLCIAMLERALQQQNL